MLTILEYCSKDGAFLVVHISARFSITWLGSIQLWRRRILLYISSYNCPHEILANSSSASLIVFCQVKLSLQKNVLRYQAATQISLSASHWPSKVPAEVHVFLNKPINSLERECNRTACSKTAHKKIARHPNSTASKQKVKTAWD